MASLTTYQQETQRLLHDPSGAYYSLPDLTAYINIARGQVALESQSVRVLVCGSISSVTIAAGGTGYTAPIVSVGGSGMGAVITPQLSGGVITSCTVNSGGTSYDTVANTTLTVTDATGSGARLTPVLVGSNLTVVGQEIYPFSTVLAAAQQINSGVQSILGVNSISVSWGAMKPMLDRRTWTDFQANFRAWTTGYISQPAVWAQFGQGVNGSVYLCPIPSEVLNMDWDVFCGPIALSSGTTPEAIPYPWTDCVPYYAAFLAYSNSQQSEKADGMLKIYNNQMKRARAMSDSSFIPSPYA